MSEFLVWLLCAIGVAALMKVIVWPILWAILYATGYAIFIVRAARVGGGASLTEYVRHLPAYWWKALMDALFRWPASEVTIGRMKWTPLFGYSGFKKEAGHG